MSALESKVKVRFQSLMSIGDRQVASTISQASGVWSEIGDAFIFSSHS